MVNVQALMAGGVSFPHAYLGHMAAETVISHNVMTSGLFPKHMGWSNEVFRDVDDVLSAGAGAYHVTSSLGCSDFATLIEAGGYPKLEDFLGRLEEDGDARFVTIAQKTTAACTAGHPADENDIIIRMGGRITADCDGDGVSERWRGPAGVNVPPYIATPCGRFFVNVTPTYDTATTAPAWMYPLDGDRFAVGRDPAHLGGDVWVADAAIAIIQREPDWRGMLLSFGSIDKMGHMWGPRDRALGEAHLPFIARTADLQVGRVLAALEAAGLLDETLVVLTADHGAIHGRNFQGVNVGGSCQVDVPGFGPHNAGDTGNCNWYYGNEGLGTLPPGVPDNAVADEAYLSPSPAIRSLVEATQGNIAFSYQDGHVAAWLIDRSRAAKRRAADALLDLPGVIASFFLNGAQDAYVLRGTNPMGRTQRRWFEAHGQELVDTMAAPFGPDVVGLLDGRTTYGVIGDHGGHQRKIQDIPIVFSWPGLRAGARPSVAMRSVDILPTVLRLLGIRFDPGALDGRAVELPRGR
jgi:hypothetical protein